MNNQANFIMNDFNEQYDLYKKIVEETIEYYITKINCQQKLKEAMAYSLRAGGKRLRPVMFFATLDMLGIDYKNYAAFAFALESIHTYSLIHDDLPAMDNDDYRRGKPSNHKVFGEGIAILAGDALLNYAIEVLFDNIIDKNTFFAAKELVNFAGHSGMINGQAYDLSSENLKISDEDKKSLLDTIDENKTGKLLTAPLTMASLIAGGKYYDELKRIGQLTGKLFQYSDDLLDVIGSFDNMGKTLGKDENANKLTAISVYGKDGTKNIINTCYSEIIKTLKIIGNNKFFEDFYVFMKDRNS